MTEVDEKISKIIEKAMDDYLSNINSFYDNFVRRHMPGLVEAIVVALDKSNILNRDKKIPTKHNASHKSRKKDDKKKASTSRFNE